MWDPEASRQAVWKDDLGDTAEAATAGVREAAAGVRCVLRKVYKMAMTAEETQELVRLVEVYSRGCLRLMKLLRIQGNESERQEAEIAAAFNQALREVVEELGLE